MSTSTSLSALDIAAAIRAGTTSAAQVLQDCIDRIEARDTVVNSFITHTFERARAEAAAVDAARARGAPLAPLAGVPYAVKNLFDIADVVTLSGGKVNAGNAPAARDAALIERMSAAGAVLVGALNMDEHAYGFSTENTHYGPTRNPHDPTRISGGSSGGSAAAIAAGLVPLTLGSDTNGSIRVPSSLCGTFGLKPTYGRLSRARSFPFVASLDHLGPFAAHVDDLALAYDLMQGADADDIGCAGRAVEPAAHGQLPPGARIAVLGGYFHDWAGNAARAAVRRAAQTLGAIDTVELPGAAQARAAAFIITGAEGGSLHRQRLLRRYDEYEPLSRDRLVAGSLIPASWVLHAQRVRHRCYRDAMALFADYDLLIAPATPVQAPRIGTETLVLNGQTLPSRPSMGLLTQPISCIGLPVAAAPMWPDGEGEGALPIAVQLIAAPWREDLCLAAARALEQAGVAVCRIAA